MNSSDHGTSIGATRTKPCASIQCRDVHQKIHLRSTPKEEVGPGVQNEAARDASRSVLALAVVAAGFCSCGAWASETGATNFPIGVNTAAAALFPPAGGTEYYNYNVVYKAGSYQATLGNPNPLDFHTLVFVEAFRINHTWANLTPDITLGSGLALNFIHQSITVAGRHGDNGFQFGDPAFIPYFFDFHVLPNLWVSHILNIFPSWGQYSRSRLANAGLGFTTFAPEVALTYLPTPRWEVSLDAWAGFNMKNTSTNYQTGNEFNMDYLLGYRPLMKRVPGLQFGLVGYVYTQWTDDALNGVRVGDGNRGHVLAVGPQIRYDIGQGGLIAKWEHEFGVQNRSTGDRFWVQFAVPL